MVSLKLLLIAHLIGDFFLQPVKLVEQKKNSIKGLIIHTIIYTLMIASVLLLFGNIWEITFWTFLIFISHFAIDYVRIKINKNNKNNNIRFYSFVLQFHDRRNAAPERLQLARLLRRSSPLRRGDERGAREGALSRGELPGGLSAHEAEVGRRHRPGTSVLRDGLRSSLTHRHSFHHRFGNAEDVIGNGLSDGVRRTGSAHAGRCRL